MPINKSSLLERFNIPLSHLDFDYIKSCKDIKEIEKIFRILHSGEEGHFPDLTKCAEERLKELNPQSKWLRTEEPLKNKNYYEEKEWQEISEPLITWIDEIKTKDKFLSTISGENRKKEILEPIRGKELKIDISDSNSYKNKNNSTTTKLIKSNSNRIKSTDYQQWDNYDADTEILKMELQEERIKEENERMEDLKREKENEDMDDDWNIDLDKLTDIEKEILAARYKDSGNDYYRAGEYKSAIKEYTKHIKILPTAIGYNNRAMAYLKLVNYKKCLEDCEACLQYDPNNIKALFRKGQALIELGKKQEAYDIYSKIISLEPSNAPAKNILNSLKKDTADFPPPTPPLNATRIQIKQDSSPETSPRNNINKNETKQANSLNQFLNQRDKLKAGDNLSKLILPHKIVKSNLAKAVEKMETIKKKADSQKFHKNSINPNNELELNLFSTINSKQKRQKNNLIQEI